MPASAADIDALLPQTQCQRCGFDGCMPYAQAVAAGEADINRCPPGGDETVHRLATLTGRIAKPIAAECDNAETRRVAFVREAECIGCTKCIQVCPVDAIVGAAKQMHTIIASECTGCELCVPACPVDCIDMPVAQAGEGQPHWPPQTRLDTERAARARQRYEARNTRLQHQRAEKQAQRAEKHAALKTPTKADTPNRKQEIADAIARAKAKRARQAGQT